MEDVVKTIELTQAQQDELNAVQKRADERAKSGSTNWVQGSTFNAMRTSEPYSRMIPKRDDDGNIIDGEKVEQWYVRAKLLGSKLPDQSVRVPSKDFDKSLFKVTHFTNPTDGWDFWQLGMGWKDTKELLSYASIVKEATNAFASLDAVMEEGL